MSPDEITRWMKANGANKMRGHSPWGNAHELLVRAEERRRVASFWWRRQTDWWCHWRQAHLRSSRRTVDRGSDRYSSRCCSLRPAVHTVMWREKRQVSNVWIIKEKHRIIGINITTMPISHNPVTLTKDWQAGPPAWKSHSVALAPTQHSLTRLFHNLQQHDITAWWHRGSVPPMSGWSADYIQLQVLTLYRTDREPKQSRPKRCPSYYNLSQHCLLRIPAIQ